MADPGNILIQHCQVCPDQTPLLSALCQKCGYIFGFCCNCGSICEYCVAIENAGFFNPDAVIKVLVTTKNYLIIITKIPFEKLLKIESPTFLIFSCIYIRMIPNLLIIY